MKHHYSPPYKEKSLWYVEKINSQTKNVLRRHEFANRKLADEYLETINIYIDGELKYSGV